MKYEAQVEDGSITWRVEFELPSSGDFVVVDLYRNDIRIDGHGVRWYRFAKYLANYSRAGEAGFGLRGGPLFDLSDLIEEQLGTP